MDRRLLEHPGGPAIAEQPPELSRLRDVEGPRAAVFDADGTLWRGDVSEDFTRWMIEHGHFDRGLWDGYAAANAADPAEGCVKVLEFYAGMEIHRVHEHVEEFWTTAPERPWIEPTVAAMRWLRDLGFTILVVSGTPSPVLRPLAQRLPIDLDQVLGLELEVDAGGRATGRHEGIPTFGPGKARRIEGRTGDPVFLAVGDSTLDLEMMKLSRLLVWAVNPDDTLRAVAQRENWLVTEDDGSR